MSHAYQNTKEQIAKSFKRIHGNGEETHVYILSCGQRFVTIAADVDPKEFNGLDGQVIAYSPTIESAHEQAIAFMENNPKGLLGDVDEPESKSWSGRIMQWMQKLNQQGNQMVEGMEGK